MTDVVVVGAGPAGCAAAIHLQRRGVSVTIVDRAFFPRDKFCGDGLTTAALREMADLGLRHSEVRSWHEVREVTVRGPYGRTVVFPLPAERGFAAVATRYDLDAALVDLARLEGAKVLEGHGVESIRMGGRAPVTITAGGVELDAEWVVAADGMWSPTRRLLDVAQPGYLGEWHAFRQYWRGVDGLDPNRLEIMFEADILPGYFWAFPLGGGRANIGFGIARGGKMATREMRTAWPDLLRRSHIATLLGSKAEPEAPHRAWPIPCDVRHPTAAAGRVLFVGDAVAAADPMTGEGIGQALLTGRLAAEVLGDALGSTRVGRRVTGEIVTAAPPHTAITLGGAAYRRTSLALAGDTSAAAVRAIYRARLDRSLVADQAMSRLLTRALRHRKGAEIAIAVAGATPWTRRNFARWLFEDYPRAVLATPSRWRRGMFTSPGADLTA